MKTDALNRRKRNAPRQAIDVRIEIEPGDIAVLSALNRHGLLHTEYLYEFRKPFAASYPRHQDRLTKLYNGCCAHRPRHKDGECPAPTAYLARDPEQEENRYYGKGNSLVYGLTDHALQTLNGAGLGLRYHFRRSNSYPHDFGLGCFTASFELQARKFRFREELLDHPKCPPATRAEKAPFHFDGVYPDDIFGNEYDPGRSRFFALEFDRAQKSARGTASNTIEHTLKAYQEVLNSRSFERLGLPNITVLFATTKVSKMNAVLQVAREVIAEEFRPHLLFKTFTDFDTPFRTPKKVLDVMAGWVDPGGNVQDISRKA